MRKKFSSSPTLSGLHGQSKGQTISLDKLREHIFGYGGADEDTTPKELQDALDLAKKDIHGQLRLATQLRLQQSLQQNTTVTTSTKHHSGGGGGHHQNSFLETLRLSGREERKDTRVQRTLSVRH
jgi:hypothetical protein